MEVGKLQWQGGADTMAAVEVFSDNLAEVIVGVLSLVVIF